MPRLELLGAEVAERGADPHPVVEALDVVEYLQLNEIGVDSDTGVDVESVGQLDGDGLPLGRGDLNAHLRAAVGEAVFSRLRDVHGGVCAGVRDVDGVAWVGIPVVPGRADVSLLIRFLGGYR